MKGDIKLILSKVEYISETQKDHETRIRGVETETTVAKNNINTIIAIAGIVGGLTTTILGIVGRYLLGFGV